MIEIQHLFFTMHTNCNFSCQYCWQRKNNIPKTKLYFNRILNILDFFYENYFLFYPKNTKIKFTFSGGEGLLYPKELELYLKKIYEYKNMGNIIPVIYVQTNGKMLTKEISNILKKYQVIIQLSYDGLGQNITRQDKNIIYSNLISSLNLGNKIMITSIFTPETINLIYQTFQELKDLSIIQWSIGLNFLENKNSYDFLILKDQLELIENNNTNLQIKNFIQAKNSNFILKEQISSIKGINITPYGEYIPINYSYSKSENINLGNDSLGLDEEKYQNYVSKKLEILKSNSYKNNKHNLNIKIVNNLLNF